MLWRTLLLSFFLLLLPLVAATPDLTNIYSTQEELAPAMSLNFQSQNVLFNDRGEKELFFDSVNSRGEIEVTPLIGDTVLLGGFKTYAVDIKPSSVQNREIKQAWDKKPTFSITNSGNNKVQIAYNSLSRECGGNYVLFFTAMNPSLTEQGSTSLGFQRQVKLRLHILCKADLLMVVSPLPGEPPQNFLVAVNQYFEALAKTKVTVRLDQLSADSFKSSSSKSLIATEFNKDYYLSSRDAVDVSPGLSAMLVDTTEIENGSPISKSKIIFYAVTDLSDEPRKEKIGEVLLGNSGVQVHETFKGNYGQVTTSFDSNPFSGYIGPKWYKFNLRSNDGTESSIYVFPSSFCALTKIKDNSALSTVLNGYSNLITATFSPAFHAFSLKDYLLNNPEEQGIVYSSNGCWFNRKLPFYLGDAGTDPQGGIWLNLGDTKKDSLPKYFSNIGDYFEIGTYRVTLEEKGPKEYIGINVHLAGSFTSETLQDILQDFEKSKKVKTNLESLRSLYHEKYLLLVGSVHDIPMPIDPEFGISGKVESFGKKGLIPSDWRYAYDADKNRFEFVVARLPSINSNSESWVYPILALENIARIRNSNKNQEDKTLKVLADACGDNNNCFIRREVIEASQKFSGPCNENSPNCLWSPSYCTSSFSGCSGLSELLEQLKTSDYLVINEHGSGEDFGAKSEASVFHSVVGGYNVVLSGEDVQAKFKPRFPLIVETFACYGGSIDYDYMHNSIASEESTALAFIATGSPLFMGNSRLGKGSTTDVDLDINNLVLASISRKDSRPAGEIMMEKKNEGLLNGEDWLVWTKQLYGDPLLPFYRAS